MKTKSLKTWQVLLIIFSIIILSVGGVFLYFHFTTGLGPQTILPEETSFNVSDDENFNTTSGRIEVDGDFSITIGSTTENLSEKEITLSFTESFTEKADEDGYITDGNIKVLQKAKIGEPIDVVIMQQAQGVQQTSQSAETETEVNFSNVGGVSSLFAKTQNKNLAPTSIKIAVDVVATAIQTSFKYTNNEIIDKNNESFDITKDSHIEISTNFTPAKSGLLYADLNNPKYSFFEIIEGVNYLKFKTDSEGNSYYDVVGEIGEKIVLMNYAFKKAQDQKVFDEYIKNNNISQDNFYETGLSYLKENPNIAISNQAEIKITEAKVSSFEIRNIVGQVFNINKNQSFVAMETSLEDSVSLDVLIKNEFGDDELSVVGNLGLRVLEDKGEGFVQTDAVDINKNLDPKKLYLNGGSYTTTSSEEVSYTLINDLSNPKNSYWEFSSKTAGNYVFEVVLFERDNGGYKIFQENGEDKVYRINVSFEQPEDEEIDWISHENMNLELGATGASFATPLNNLTNVPSQNIYRTEKFFAYGGDLTSSNEYEFFGREIEPINVEGKGDVFEISPTQIIKEAGDFKIFFATILTDANGEPILNENKYQFVKFSQDIIVSTTKTVDFTGAVFAVNADGGYKFETSDSDDFKYVIPQGTENAIEMFIHLEGSNAELLVSQESKIMVKAFHDGEEVDVVQISEVKMIYGDDAAIITLSVNDNVVAGYQNEELLLSFQFIYERAGRDFVKSDIVALDTWASEKKITIYDNKPSQVNWGGTGENAYEVTVESDGKKTLEGEEGSVATTAFVTSLTSTTLVDKYGKTPITSGITFEGENGVSKTESDLNFTITQGTSRLYAIYNGERIGEPIVFTLNSTKITEVKSVEDLINDVASQTTTENGTDIREVTIEKLGYKDNQITLSNLISIYAGSGIAISNTNYYFTLSQADINEKENLFGLVTEGEGRLSFTPNKMIGVVGLSNIDNLTTTTKIETLYIANDFGRDYTLTLNVQSEVFGLNFQVKLKILSNIESTSNNFGTFAYELASSTSTPKETTTTENNTKVYAQYPIDLNSALVVEKVYVASTKIDWATAKVKIGQEDASGLTDGTYTFAEVFEPSEVEFSVYEINNTFAYKFTETFTVYPNFKSTPTDKIDEFTLNEILNGEKDLSIYHSVDRYVGGKAIAKNSLTPTEDSATLELQSGEFEFEKTLAVQKETFAVSYEKDNKVAKDYQGNDLIQEFNLTLGYTLLQIAGKVESMEVVTYDGQEMLFIKEGKPCDFTTEGIYNDMVLQPDDSQYIYGTESIQYLSKDNLIRKSHIIYAFKDGEDKRIARIQYPVIVSAFERSDFVKYEIQETDDLKILLAGVDIDPESASSQDGDVNVLETNDIEQVLKAGSTYDIFNSEYGFSKGSGLNNVITIHKNITQNGQELAEMDGDNLKINHLAGDNHEHIIIKMTSNRAIGTTTISLSQYFRIKVTPSLRSPTINTDSNVFVEIDEGAQKEIDLTNNFEIKDNSDSDAIIDSELIVSEIYKANNKIEFTQVGNTYTANGITIVVENANEISVLVSNTEKYEIILRKIYTDVVNGAIDFVMFVNASKFEYQVIFDKVSGENPELKDNNLFVTPVESGSFQVDLVTQANAGSSWGSVSPDDTKTILSVNLPGEEPQEFYDEEVGEFVEFYLHGGMNEEEDFEDYSISAVETGALASFKYDYTTQEFKITGLTYIPKIVELELTFKIVINGGSDNEIETTPNNTLKITLLTNHQITEKTTELFGGMSSYGVGDLINETVGATATIKSVKTKADSDANFVKIEIDENTSESTFTTAMMKEDADCVFEIQIVEDDNNYFFTIERTIKQNVLHDGKVLNNNEEEVAYINAGSCVAGESFPFEASKYLEFEEDIEVEATGGNESSDTGITFLNGNNPLSIDLLNEENVIKEGPTIYNTGTITFEPSYVSAEVDVFFAFRLTYKFGDSFGYDFVVKIQLNVKPSVRLEVNYPKPAETELEKETISVTETTTVDREDDLTVVSVDGDVITVTFAEGGKVYKGTVQKDDTNYTSGSTTIKLKDDNQATLTYYVIDSLLAFFNGQHELADDSRIAVFDDKAQKVREGLVESENQLSIKIKSKQNVTVFQETTNPDDPIEENETLESDKKTSLSLSDETNNGNITFTVTYKGVFVDYTIDLSRSQVYSFKSTMVTENAESEIIYDDAIEEKDIFNKNRILEIKKSPSQVNEILAKMIGKNIVLEFERKSPEKTHKVEFVYQEALRNVTFYLDAGISLGDYTLNKIYNAKDNEEIYFQNLSTDPETSVNPFEIRKTQRIELMYLGERVSKEYSGEVTSLNINPDKTGSFEEGFSIKGLNSSIGYTADFSLEVNEKVVLSNQYKFSIALDIAVEAALKFEKDANGDPLETFERNSYITITALEGVNDFVELAGVHNPSKTAGGSISLLTPDMLSTAEVEIDVVAKTISDANSNDFETKIFNAFKTAFPEFDNNITTATNKMAADSDLKYLTFGNIKTVQEDNDTTWNFNLVGEGAENEGSWVLVKYTYTAKGSSVSEIFYVMVRILPNYSVQVNGSSITSTETNTNGTFKQENASNKENPVNVAFTESDADGSYKITVIGQTEIGDDTVDGVLSVSQNTKTHLERNPDWKYVMINNDYRDEGFTYNKNLSEFNQLKTTPSNGWSVWENEETNPAETGFEFTYGDNNLTLTKTDSIPFGEFAQVIRIEDEYGYEIDFYFTMKSKSQQTPQTYEGNPTAIIEGDSFDIGAIYEEIALTAQDEETYNVYQEGESLGEIEGTILTLNEVSYTISEKNATADDETTITSSEEFDPGSTFSYEGKRYLIKEDDSTIVELTIVGKIDGTILEIWGDEEHEGIYEIEGSTATKIADNTKTLNITLPTGSAEGKIESNESTPSKIYTIKKEKNYNHTIQTKVPGAGDDNLTVFNISGVDAWGIRCAGDNSPTDSGRVPGIDGKYLLADGMNLQHLTVENIVFKKNNVEVGSFPERNDLGELDSQDYRPITASGLKLSDVGEGVYLAPSNTPSNTPYFTMPNLASWIYSDAVTSEHDQEIQTANDVEMIITLKYEDSVRKHSLSLDVRQTISVTRELKTDKEHNAVVKDGEEFELDRDPKQIEVTEPETSTFLDDTLFVTLPKAGGSNSKISIEVTAVNASGEDVASFETKLSNSSSIAKTFSVGLSKNLKDDNKNPYMLKNTDKLKFTFTEFEDNGNIPLAQKLGDEVSGQAEHFYATYGKVNVWKGDDLTDDPKKLETGNIEVYSVADKKDTIKIPTPEAFNKTAELLHNGVTIFGKYAEVVKHYLVVANSMSYRVEKKYLVTPSVFATNLDEVVEQTHSYAVESSGETINAPDNEYNGGYYINFATWAEDIDTYSIKGSSTLSIVDDNTSFNGDSSKYRFEVRNSAGETGMGFVGSDGVLYTAPGYALNSEEYIPIFIYAKASGVDGEFGVESENDILLGSVRVRVTGN